MSPPAAGPGRIDLNGIVIIVGSYGSGKTEVAVNLALHHRRRGRDVQIADLDLINPYFRTREARIPLREMGVGVVLPPEPYLHADLPILSPAVAGMLRRAERLTLLDVGGSDAGATVLASLADVLGDRRPQVLQVVNPYRPFADTPAGVRRVRESIEAAAKLPVTGLVANPNLIDETGPDEVLDGYRKVVETGRHLGLPLEFMAVRDTLLPTLDRSRFDCPLLPIHRQMLPPWTRPARTPPSAAGPGARGRGAENGFDPRPHQRPQGNRS